MPYKLALFPHHKYYEKLPTTIPTPKIVPVENNPFGGNETIANVMNLTGRRAWVVQNFLQNISAYIEESERSMYEWVFDGMKIENEQAIVVIKGLPNGVGGENEVKVKKEKGL